MNADLIEILLAEDDPGDVLHEPATGQTSAVGGSMAPVRPHHST